MKPNEENMPLLTRKQNSHETVYRFCQKEFHHILRDRRTMLILIGMPIVQIILFGFAISTEVRNVQTAILAPSLQTDVRKVMEQLDASEYFTVKYVVQSPDEIERLFRRNLIELAVVFPPTCIACVLTRKRYRF